MANVFTERIKVILDVVEQGAVGPLAKFRQDLATTDTAVGKAKTTMSAGFDFVKANAAKFALGAGGALVGFGVTAVAKFQEAALAAGKFSDATDLSTEASSRWLDVTKRYGVELPDLLDVFNNVAGKIAEGAPVFDELGVAIAHTADGSVDLNETMIRVVETMGQVEDPATRARYAAELFGEEGSRQFAELIAKGGEFRDVLDDVADGKLISPEEVDRARRTRETLQALQTTVEELAVEIGGALVDALEEAGPALEALGDLSAGAVRGLGRVFGVAESLGTKIGHALSPWNAGAREANRRLVEAFEESEQAAASFDMALLSNARSFQEAQAKALEYTGSEHAANLVALEWKRTEEELGHAVDGVAKAQTYAADTGAELALINELGADAADAYARKAHFAADETDNLRNDFADLKEELSDRNAFLDAMDGFDDLERAAVEAYTAAATKADDAERKGRDYQRAINDQKTRILELGESIDGLPEQAVTNILTLIDGGQYAEAERRIANLARERDVPITPRIIITGGNRGVRVDEHGNVRAFAHGKVPGARGAPQLAILHGDERVQTAADVDAETAAGPSSVTYVTNNWPAGVNPAAVREAERAYARRNGPT